MKRTLTTASAICILLLAGVFAGCSEDSPVPVSPAPPEVHVAGTIGVYSDAAGTDPNVVDTGGVVTLYVVHKIADGGTASAFTIEAPDGWDLVSAVSEYPVTIGDIDAGISIAYGECLTGAIQTMTLTYDSPGNTAAGSTFKVMPHPAWPDNIRVVDCNSTMLVDGVGMESHVVTP